MFKQFLNKFILTADNTTKKKYVNFNFVLSEILSITKVFLKKFDKKKKVSKKKPNIILSNTDEIFKKILHKRLSREINKNIFHIKEEFLFSFSNNVPLFKKERENFYLRELTIYQLWAIYTQKPFFIFDNKFYLRHKNVFKLFNTSAKALDAPKSPRRLLFKNSYWGLVSIWNAIKIWVFSLSITLGSFYIMLVKRSSVLPQTLFFWLALSMLLYWLLSGFIFFVKKYQYSRYTSVIQRFWRRSYILFWLIESGLLIVFFYLTVNSSQESFYMFDQGYFFKTHLFSWKLFLFKSILIVSLISYSYVLLLNLKWSTFNKNILNLIILTLILIYFLWIEFYQIYWVSNFYSNFSWFYDVDETAWALEFDGRRTRILNHYIMVLFLLKFWHIVFIFGCWVFFLLRANELETITYPLYSFNFQNFIILFLMTWLFMYPWFKHTLHWLIEIPYYWFYVDTHTSFYKILVNDIYYFYYNVFSQTPTKNLNLTLYFSKFSNWFLIDAVSDQNVFIKFTIKNEILKNLI